MDNLKVFSCFAKLGNLIAINIYRDGKFLCGIDLTPSQADKLMNDIMREQISLKDQEKEMNNFFKEHTIGIDPGSENGDMSVFGGFRVCPCGYIAGHGESCRKCGRSQ